MKLTSKQVLHVSKGDTEIAGFISALLTQNEKLTEISVKIAIIVVNPLRVTDCAKRITYASPGASVVRLKDMKGIPFVSIRCRMKWSSIP